MQIKYGSARISFCNLSDFTQMEAIDLRYTNGVFHHIIPEKRVGLISRIHKVLKPGGYFALCENNSWNLGSRLVMKRIPFDGEAKLLSSWRANQLLQEGGYSHINPARFLFYFPKIYGRLRWMESYLDNFLLEGASQ